MKTLKSLLSLLFFLLIVASCGGDDDTGTSSGDCTSQLYINTQLQTDVDAFNAAGAAYGNNPSPANCAAFKAAAQGYFNAVIDLEDCYSSLNLEADYQANIQNAQAAIDDIMC